MSNRGNRSQEVSREATDGGACKPLVTYRYRGIQQYQHLNINVLRR